MFGRHAEAAGCLYWGAFCLESLGRSQDALARYDEARGIFVTIGPSENVAPCLFNRARCLPGLDRHQEALDGFDEARERYAAQGAVSDEADSAYSAVMCLISLDRHKGVVLRSDEVAGRAGGTPASSVLTGGGSSRALRLLRCRVPTRKDALMDSRFREVFPEGHVVLPVIHVSSEDQALRNAGIAFGAGANGAFLINHSMGCTELLAIHARVVEAFPGWWLGVNCLDLDPVRAVRRASPEVAGIWSDNAMIRETQEGQPEADAVLAAIRETGWPGLYFGGVAFKYQEPVDDLRAAAHIAGAYMDVVTTSGAGTGQAASLEKIAAMKAALGDLPLAIASGITPENVRDYLPISDCYLVATGIGDSFEELNPSKVAALVGAVREWDAGEGRR